jgi:uncharacterized protein (TIRG00374 family)
MQQDPSHQPKQVDLSKILNRLFFIIVVGIAGNLIFVFLKSDQDIMDILGRFSPGFLLIALILAILPWFGHCFRMMLWSRLLDNGLSLHRALQIAVATDLGAAITPTIVGGAPVKLGLLIQSGFRPGIAAALVALGSLEELLFYLIAVPVACAANLTWLRPYFDLFVKGVVSLGGSILPAMCVFVIGTLILIRAVSKTENLRLPLVRRTRQALRRCAAKFNTIGRDMKHVSALIWQKGKMIFLISMFATCLQWLCRYAILSVLILGIGVQIDHLQLFLRQGLVFAAMIFIPTPGAIGGAEATFYGLFGSILPGDVIAIVTAAWRFLTYYIIMLAAVVFIVILSKFNRMAPNLLPARCTSHNSPQPHFCDRPDARPKVFT